MATEAENNWEGQVSTKIHGYKPEQIWPLLEDFFNLHKVLSTMDTCYGVEGISGQPGCIRYCAATSSSLVTGEIEVKWALEKLVAIYPNEYRFRYVFVDNNCGFDSFMATMKLLPLARSVEEGCEMIFAFVVSPVGGWRFEDLTEFYNSSLHEMAKGIEKVIAQSCEHNLCYK